MRGRSAAVRRIAGALALFVALSSAPAFAGDDLPLRHSRWGWLDGIRQAFARVMHSLDDGGLWSPPGSH
jgi:hypothetical protein